MSKTFSVVTLTYNSALYLEETLQSVLYQRGDFFIDYVVVDNSSTDATLKILEKYQAEIASECFKCNCLGVTLRFISESDSGMYDALCKGIRMCNGDFFSYINSDDFYLPNAFATVSDVFINNKLVNWLTGVPSLYNAEGAITTLDIPCVYNQKYMQCGVYGRLLPYLQQESTFWRRDLCDELSLDSLASFKYAGDYYIWNVFSRKNKLHTVDAQLSGFRLHDGNKSLDKQAYANEFKSIVTGKLMPHSYVIIITFKVLYKIIGNNFLKYIPGVIRLH